MRWIARVTLLAGLAGLVAGCSHTCYLPVPDSLHYAELVPADLDHNASASQPPPLSALNAKAPATVLNPETREPWHVTLQEAIAISLDNGTTGIQAIDNPGKIPDDLITNLQLPQLQFASDSFRVLALQPAIVGASIEANLSRFDVKWVSQMLYSHTDQQTNSVLNTSTNGDRTSYETGFYKLMADGGTVGITTSNVYQNLANPTALGTVINPSYTPRVDVVFDQPLLQNFGVDVNQLLNRPAGVAPGTSLSPAAQSGISNYGASAQGGSAGFGTDGIMISRIRFDQSRAEFERVVNYKLVNVEVAYWNLYAAYVNLYASEQGLRMSHLVWARYKYLKEVGGGGGKDQAPFKPYFEDRARGQYELFAGDRTQALGQVLEAERVLRRLMGLPADDGKQLIPIDPPTLTPFVPDWQSALEETMNLRPELIMLREELRLRQLDVDLQKNFLKPDLRFVSRYGVSAVGGSLAGTDTTLDPSTGQMRPTNALRGLATTNFSDWNLGLTMTVALGYKYEQASIRRARLALAQGYWAVKNEEAKAESFLTKTYRDIFDNYEQVKHRRAQREGFGKALEQTLELSKGGQIPAGSEEILQAQRDYVNALRQEAQAIAGYNSSLALFEFAKGTLLKHDSILINEGGLPACAAVRAVDHERERSKALLLHEHPLPHTALDPVHGDLGLPQFPMSTYPSASEMLDGAGIDPTTVGRNVPASGDSTALTHAASSYSPSSSYSPTNLLSTEPSQKNVNPPASVVPEPAAPPMPNAASPWSVPNLTPAAGSTQNSPSSAFSATWMTSAGAAATPAPTAAPLPQ